MAGHRLYTMDFQTPPFPFLNSIEESTLVFPQHVWSLPGRLLIATGFVPRILQILVLFPITLAE